MMTETDYKLLAVVVAGLGFITMKEVVVRKLTTALKLNNHKFSEKEFIKACYSK